MKRTLYKFDASEFISKMCTCTNQNYEGFRDMVYSFASPKGEQKYYVHNRFFRPADPCPRRAFVWLYGIYKYAATSGQNGDINPIHHVERDQCHFLSYFEQFKQLFVIWGLQVTGCKAKFLSISIYILISKWLYNFVRRTVSITKTSY